MAADRPPPPFEARPSTRWEPYPDDRGWELVGGEVASRRCRRRMSGGYCQWPSVARLNRGTEEFPDWWHYCERHLYGGWVQDGRLMRWRMVDA